MIKTEKTRKKITIEETTFTEVSCDYCNKKFDFDENNQGNWIEVDSKCRGGLYFNEICQKCFKKFFKDKTRYIGDRFEEFELPTCIKIIGE